jgi:two-component system phosphate regulon sensor histidine kinase PhoR
VGDAVAEKRRVRAYDRDFSLQDLEAEDSPFRFLAERLGAGVFLIQDGRLRYANRKLAGTFGYGEPGAAGALDVQALIHPEDRARTVQGLERVPRGEDETVHLQFRGIRENGEVIHLEAYGSRIHLEGRPAVLGTLVDVTDRMEAGRLVESRLKTFQALYKLALAMVADRTLDENLSVIVGESRELLGTDTAWIALNDHEARELCWHISSGLRSEPFKRLRVPLNMGLAGKVARSGHWLIVEDYYEEIGPELHEVARAEGLISGIAVPVQIGDQNFGVLFAFNRVKTRFSKADLDTLSLFGNLAAVEITRKRALENLSESEQRYRELYRESRRQEELYHSFLSSTVDAIVVYDAEGCAQYVNASFTRMFGWTLDELNRGEVPPVPEGEAGTDAFLRASVLEKGQSVSGFETRRRARDGTVRDVSVSASPYHDTDGRVSGMTLILRDITALKSLERARKKAVNHLSHELVTPISLMEASLKQLGRPNLEPEKKDRILDRIQRNLKRLMEIQEIVQEIAVPRPYRPRTIQVDRVVEEILERMRKRIVHRRGELLSSLTPVHTDAVDPAVLERAVHTLVKNAIENTPDEGRITVTLTPEPDGLVLRVEDRGVGIEPADRDFIWQGFYHTQPTELYSTRKPYDFGAGGKGLELMRLRLLAEEGGFGLDLDSSRCVYLADGGSCCGRISACPHVRGPEECIRSGGTTFTVRFPWREPAGEEGSEPAGVSTQGG